MSIIKVIKPHKSHKCFEVEVTADTYS